MYLEILRRGQVFNKGLELISMLVLVWGQQKVFVLSQEEVVIQLWFIISWGVLVEWEGQIVSLRIKGYNGSSDIVGNRVGEGVIFVIVSWYQGV